MNMIRHDDVTAELPANCTSPGLNQKVVNIRVRKDVFAIL